MKPPISKLDYIEVPNDKWYYSKRNDEVYQFDNGLFRAHQDVKGISHFIKHLQWNKEVCTDLRLLPLQLSSTQDSPHI